MSASRLDVTELYRRVDERRQGLGLSWRALGRELGLSASTLTRMGAGGGAPDADALVTLLVWLGSDSGLAGLVLPGAVQR